MNTRYTIWNRLLWLTVFIMAPGSAFSADCPADIKATTNGNADVAVEILSSLVKPLTKCELEIEAQAWILLLKEKMVEISDAEVAAIRKREAIEHTEDIEDSRDDLEQAAEDADSEDMQEAKENAATATKELKEVKKQLAQDKDLQKTIAAAKNKVEESEDDDSVDAEPVDVGSRHAADNSIDTQEEVKTALVKYIAVLTAERTAIVDRLDIVLADLDAKGGETDEYDTYIKAVSGVELDVTDASATWISVTGW